jgi:AraC family transcriptional regulator
VAEVRRSMNSVPQELQGDIADRISLAAELLHPASVSYTPSFNRDLVRSPLTSSRGGLAPWQTRKLRAFIDSNLDARISVNNLADLAGLSPSHFSRAFRTSFGKAPKAYVMLKRVTRAQELMLSCSSPLGQIAADCGLADQAHLTKLFFRFIGATPGAWRRAHRNGLPKAAGE